MGWKPFALIIALLAVTAHVPATAFEVWGGFALAVVAGIGLSVPVAMTKFGEEALMPLLVATQSIPKTALAPIFE